ncbi:uncharacterized protein [Ptychodera flava]|uniref:uncharacterized protein n=1 Tax=Ptychodera flava TaxID=63121 RepID=UPI00396A5475
MAMLYSTERNKYFCGGVLLNRRFVMTAAHCIHLSQATEQNLKVYLGKYNADEEEDHQRVYDVAEIILHPDYQVETFDADIALLRLAQRVAFSDYIIPICIPSSNSAENMLRAGKAGVVTGWGETQEDDVSPNFLREVRLQVVDHNICGDRHSNVVTNNMFCAGPPLGQEGRDACTGDSGGPFMKKSGERWYLLGLVSWGVGCANPNLPGVYTTVHRFHDWTENNIPDGEESCITTEENYESQLEEKDATISGLEATIASMTSEISTLEERLETCAAIDDVDDSSSLSSLPPVVPIDERTRCDGYCPGSFTTRAICINGFCQCLSATYDTYTCLPVVGGCEIKKNAANPAATAKLEGQDRELYSCIDNDNDDYEVHAIGVYEGRAHRTATRSTVRIQKVARPDRPIVLVLATYEPINWVVEMPNDVTIDRVLLIAYHISDTDVVARGGAIRTVERLPYSTETPYGYGNDNGGGNTAGLLLYIDGRFGPVTSFTGTYKADEWSLSVGLLAQSPSVPEAGEVSQSFWTRFAFHYDDSWTDCHGDQYVKRTSYDVGRYVGVVLCTSTKYKILLADDLEEEFLNVADQSGSGKDHCEFVGAPNELNVESHSGNIFNAPLVPGYHRAEWGESPEFGFIGGGVGTAWTGKYPARSYECGVNIPGNLMP